MIKNIIKNIAAMLMLLLFTGCVEDACLPDAVVFNAPTYAMVYPDHIEFSSVQTTEDYSDIEERGFIISYIKKATGKTMYDTLHISLDGEFETIYEDDLDPDCRSWTVFSFIKMRGRYMRGKSAEFVPKGSMAPEIKSVTVEPRSDVPFKGTITIEGSHLGRYKNNISMSIAETVYGENEFKVLQYTGNKTIIQYTCPNEGVFHLIYNSNGKSVTLDETLPVNFDYEFVDFKEDVNFGTPVNIQIIHKGIKPATMGCIVDGTKTYKANTGYFYDYNNGVLIDNDTQQSSDTHTLSIYFYYNGLYVYLKDRTIKFNYQWKKIGKFSTTSFMGKGMGNSYWYPRAFGAGYGWQVYGKNDKNSVELYRYNPANADITKYVYDIPDEGVCAGSYDSHYVITDGNDIYCMIFIDKDIKTNKVTNRLLKFDAETEQFSVVADLPTTAPASSNSYSDYAKSGNTFYFVNHTNGEFLKYDLSTKEIAGPTIISELKSTYNDFCGSDDKNMYYITNDMEYKSLDDMEKLKYMMHGRIDSKSKRFGKGEGFFMYQGRMYSNTMACSFDVPSMKNFKYYGYPKGIADDEGVYLVPAGNKLYCVDNYNNIYEFTGK